MRFYNAGHRPCSVLPPATWHPSRVTSRCPGNYLSVSSNMVCDRRIRGSHKRTRLVKAFTSKGSRVWHPVTIRFCCLTGLGVLAALASPVGGDVRPAGAAVGAVPPGPVDRRVDEDPLAGRRLAHPEPVEAEVGQPDREPHGRACGVLVRHRAAL